VNQKALLSVEVPVIPPPDYNYKHETLDQNSPQDQKDDSDFEEKKEPPPDYADSNPVSTESRDPEPDDEIEPEPEPTQSSNVSYYIIVDSKDPIDQDPPDPNPIPNPNRREKKIEEPDEEILYESGNDDDDNEDQEIIDEVQKPKNHEELYYSQFPKTFIEETKLVVRGKELTKLISKFYRLECDLCPGKDGVAVGFKKLSNLVAHYKSEHQLKGYVICCGIKFVKIRNMAMHMARHIQPDAFKCPQCQKFMTCPKILQYHIQNHLPEEERPLKCPEPGCSRRFSYQSALVTHGISHMDEADRTIWSCEDCGKTFSSSGRLSTHINVAHTK
jgi:hypothetical protein